MDDLRKFGRYFLPYKVELTLGILCILASVVFSLYIPLIVGHAIDANWSEVNWSRLTISALKVLGASVVSGIFLFLQRRILIGMSRKVEYDLRQDFYHRLVDQPLSFFQEHRTGDLMARATNDLSAVRQLVGPMIMYSLQTVFTVLVLLPLLLFLPGAPADRVQALFSEYLVFLGVRVVFGLLVPLGATVMTWRTARIRSLDSATGLLYIVAALVLAGEIAARTLLFLTGVAT